MPCVLGLVRRKGAMDIDSCFCSVLHRCATANYNCEANLPRLLQLKRCSFLINERGSNDSYN